MSAQSAMRPTDSLIEPTIDVLWRQWRAIGGAAAGGPVTLQVDPEALCMASLVLEQHEPRLWTTMTDWLRISTGLISVQRLKNLAGQFPDGQELLGRLAVTMLRETKDARYKTLLPHAGKANAKRRALGKVSPSKQRSGGPALDTPTALVLRLRAGFGVNVKADLLAFLLGQRLRVSVATATAALAYSTPTIFRALQDLRDADLVRTTDQPSGAEYWVDAARWHSVLGGPRSVASWGYWREALGYVTAVLAWERAHAQRTLSEYARGTSLREVAMVYEPDLVRAGLAEQGLVFPQSTKLDDWRSLHRRLADKMVQQA